MAWCALLMAPALAADNPRTATLAWDYDYSSQPPCTKQRTTNCIEGFRVKLGEQMEPTLVRNQFKAGKVVGKGIRARLPVRQYGDLQFCVSAVGKDAKGKETVSAPICSVRRVSPPGKR